jgi:hypothetical protein
MTNYFQGAGYDLTIRFEAIQASNNASGSAWGVDSVYDPANDQAGANWIAWAFTSPPPPPPANEMRIDLVWGTTLDLDAMAEDSTGAFCYYGNKTPAGSDMELLEDNYSGPATETINISNLDNGKTYLFYVLNNYATYSGSEKVEIYYGEQLLMTINISAASGSLGSTYWKVFSFTGKAGMQLSDLTIYNELVASQPTL